MAPWAGNVVYAGLMCGCSTLAMAQNGVENYPSKPMRIVVGFTPGTTTDITARALAQALTARLGQQVIVENREGANSGIGHTPACCAWPSAILTSAASSIKRGDDLSACITTAGNDGASSPLADAAMQAAIAASAILKPASYTATAPPRPSPLVKGTC